MHVLMKPWAPLGRFPIDQNIFLAFALTVAIIFSSETLSASSAPDSDSDGQNDFYEAICGSDPFSSESKSLDTDGDRLPDCVDNDADSNGIPDELAYGSLDPAEDADFDGYTNLQEFEGYSDPQDATSVPALLPEKYDTQRLFAQYRTVCPNNDGIDGKRLIVSSIHQDSAFGFYRNSFCSIGVAGPSRKPRQIGVMFERNSRSWQEFGVVEIPTYQSSLPIGVPVGNDKAVLEGNELFIPTRRRLGNGNYDYPLVIFSEVSSGLWHPIASVQSGSNLDSFGAGSGSGSAIAVSGDLLLVGAYSEDNFAGQNAGVAYVFRKIDGRWTKEAMLQR